MTRKIFIVIGALVASAVAGSVAGQAAGPIDGEAAVVYWMSDGTALGDGGPELDSGAISGTAELWLFDRWGARAGIYQAEFADFDEDVQYGSLDVMAKVFELTRNNYLALGVGWEDIELRSAETSGLRIVAEGRVGFASMVYGYGQAAYLPKLDEFPGFEDVNGTEFDLGVAVEPMPFLTIRAGYRNTTIDYKETLFSQDIESEAKGYHLGLGFHF